MNNFYYQNLGIKRESDGDQSPDPNQQQQHPQQQIQQHQVIQQHPQQNQIPLHYPPQNYVSIPLSHMGGIYQTSSFPPSNLPPTLYQSPSYPPYSSNSQRNPTSMIDVNQQEQYLNVMRQYNQNNPSFNQILQQNRFYNQNQNQNQNQSSPMDFNSPQQQQQQQLLLDQRSSASPYLSINTDSRGVPIRSSDQIQWISQSPMGYSPFGYYRFPPLQSNYSMDNSNVPPFLMNSPNVPVGPKQELDSTEDRNMINSLINDPAARIFSLPNAQSNLIQQSPHSVVSNNQQSSYPSSFFSNMNPSYSSLEGKNDSNFAPILSNNLNTNSNYNEQNPAFTSTTTTSTSTSNLVHRGRRKTIESSLEDSEVDPFSTKFTRKNEPEPKKRKKGSSSSSNSSSIQKVEGESNIIPFVLPPIPDYSSIPIATRFQMKRQPHNHQRRCYEDENRYVMPNPLVVMEVNENRDPDKKILDGFITAMLADDDGNLISDNLQESERLFSPDGLSHKISLNNTKASFNVKLFAPAGRRSRFRIVFLVNYQTSDGNTYWEKLLSDIIQIQCNKVFAGQDPEPSALMPNRGSPLEETEVWIRGHDFFSKGEGMKITFDGIDAKVLDISENLVSVIAPRRPDLAHKGDFTVPVSLTNLFTRKQAKSHHTINYTYSVNLRRPQGAKVATNPTDSSFSFQDLNVNQSSLENPVHSPPITSHSRRRRH